MGTMYIVQVHGAIYVHRGLGFLASTVVAIVGYQLIELHIIITPQSSAPKEIKYVGAFVKSDSRGKWVYLGERGGRGKP